MKRTRTHHLLVAALLLTLCGCDRSYVIEGKVVVARGAGAAVAPAVIHRRSTS